jgi:hypothetical protein
MKNSIFKSWIIILLIVIFSIGIWAQLINQNQEKYMLDESLRISPVALDPDVRQAFMERRRRANVLVDQDYRIWDRSVIKWKDGLYHAYYSRWQGDHKRWLTDSESCHAVAENPEGPFKDAGIVLSKRNATGWDIIDVHSQFALIAEDKVLIYYQSCDLQGKFPPQNDNPLPTREWLDDLSNMNIIRNSQRIGLAMSDNPGGPFVRVNRPVAVPEDCERCSNITDNPTVVYREGSYLMIMKSDDASQMKRFQIQFVGHSKKPQGPFQFRNEPVYDEKRTEDASMWFDKQSNLYYMVCHVLGQTDLAMFTSLDGLKWQPASQPILMKKEFLLSNGEIWKPERVEQPRILTDDNGKPIMLYVAVADKGINGNIAIPLRVTGRN